MGHPSIAMIDGRIVHGVWRAFIDADLAFLTIRNDPRMLIPITEGQILDARVNCRQSSMQPF